MREAGTHSSEETLLGKYVVLKRDVDFSTLSGSFEMSYRKGEVCKVVAELDGTILTLEADPEDVSERCFAVVKVESVEVASDEDIQTYFMMNDIIASLGDGECIPNDVKGMAKFLLKKWQRKGDLT